jgi:hypothetical protein
MSANPWMKFYPSDWRGDQGLRAVSIAARGLWIECLCVMHEAKPYGHLLLNGEPVDDGTLARMTGASVDEVSALMAELRKAGVFSVTREGVVFSRRMTKDHALASKGRKAVQKRWAQTTENVEKSGGPNRSPSTDPSTKKLEARSKIEKLNSFSERASARKPNGFVHVWKSTDAARSLIQELQENEQFGEDRGDEIIDQAVRQFPSIAHVRP